MKQCIKDLKESKAVSIPVYSFIKHQRTSEKVHLYGPTVIIVEGLFVLHDKELRDLLDLKIFVQADADLMLARRIRRDVEERGRDVNGILNQYLRFVKPSQENFIGLSSKYADIIVPGMNNSVSIQVIAEHIRKQLDIRALRFRTELSQTEPLRRPNFSRTNTSTSVTSNSSGLGMSSVIDPIITGEEGRDVLESKLPPNVHLLRQTPQLKCLLTLLHDIETSSEDFIFNTNRVARLVVEEAMGMLPFTSKEITLITTGEKHIGTSIGIKNICSVSILRSGAVLESSLRRAIQDLPLGSLLIQSSEKDGEPHLYTVSLPWFIKDREHARDSFVFLTDAQIGSGAAGFMALRVLLDHGVQEENIIFLTLLASAKGGINALQKAFPKVRIVVAGIDPHLQKLRIPYQNNSRDLVSSDSRGRNGKSPRQIPLASSSRSSSRGLSVSGQKSTFNSINHTLVESSSKPSEIGNGNSISNDPTPLSLSPTIPNEVESVSIGLEDIKSRVVFAITPGMGSIGNRYFRT